MTKPASIRLTEIPLNKIQESPWLVPTSFKIKGQLTPDENKVKKYFDILKDLNFSEYIKVWSKDDKFLVFDNYEALLALREYYRKSPEHPVTCLLVENADDVYIKTLAARLQNISTSDSHASRCVGIRTLLGLNVTPAKIREIYGASGSRSKEAKMFQRDFRIAKHDRIYNRVVGYVDENKRGILDIARPRISKATLSYALADKILGILGDDEELIQAFDLEYEKYLSHLRKGFQHEDEQVKPIYSWKSFNKAKVEGIAKYLMRRGEPSAVDPKYIFGDTSLSDRSCRFNYDESSGVLTTPQLKLNLASNDPENLKLLVDFKYHAEKTVHTLESHIKRIRPVEHGGPVRVSTIDLRPVQAIDRSNVPKFVDADYFRYVQEHKLLQYANRELLLKSIDLAAHNFGFSSYQPDAEASYKSIYTAFKKWWDDNFLPRVHQYHQSDEKRHPLYSAYISILNYLNKKADRIEMVFFGDFILELFSVVFRELDAISENKKQRLENIERSDQDAKTVLWEQILTALREAGLTETDFLNAARDRLSGDWNKSIAATQKFRLELKKAAGGFESIEESKPEDFDEDDNE